MREKTLQGVKTKRIKRETQRRQTSLQEKQRERETETTGKRLQDCGDGKRLRDEKQRETQRRQTSLQEKQRGRDRDRDDREKTSRLWRRTRTKTLQRLQRLHCIAREDTAGGQNKTYKERDAETTDFTPREAERERDRDDREKTSRLWRRKTSPRRKAERDAETTDFTPREAERERQRRQGKDFKTVETENVKNGRTDPKRA